MAGIDSVSQRALLHLSHWERSDFTRSEKSG